MPAQLTQFLQAHGVHLGFIASAALGFVLRHYWPEVRNWITGAGTDKAVIEGLLLMKSLLKKYGASDDRVRQVEKLILDIMAEVRLDIEKDVQQPSK